MAGELATPKNKILVEMHALIVEIELENHQSPGIIDAPTRRLLFCAFSFTLHAIFNIASCLYFIFRRLNQLNCYFPPYFVHKTAK